MEQNAIDDNQTKWKFVSENKISQAIFVKRFVQLSPFAFYDLYVIKHVCSMGDGTAPI